MLLMLAKQISGNGFLVCTTPVPQYIGGKVKEMFESIVLQVDPVNELRGKLIKQKHYDTPESASKGHSELTEEYIHE
jgi:hypothetical protein